jgi:hypothetical protein
MAVILSMIFSYLAIWFTIFVILFLVDQERRILREKIERDCNELSIRDLCVKKSGRYDVAFFNLEEKFCTMISRITEIKYSRIFDKLWRKYGEKLKDKVLTMEVIFENLWLPVCEKLMLINQQFLSGDMLLKDIDKYLKLFDTDYEALEEEFLLLLTFFSDDTASYVNNEVKRKLGAIIERVKNYKKLFDARDAAQAILSLQEKIGLKGDFSAIEHLEKVSVCFDQFTCLWHNGYISHPRLL